MWTNLVFQERKHFSKNGVTQHIVPTLVDLSTSCDWQRLQGNTHAISIGSQPKHSKKCYQRMFMNVYWIHSTIISGCRWEIEWNNTPGWSDSIICCACFDIVRPHITYQYVGTLFIDDIKRGTPVKPKCSWQNDIMNFVACLVILETAKHFTKRIIWERYNWSSSVACRNCQACWTRMFMNKKYNEFTELWHTAPVPFVRGEHDRARFL